LCTRRWTARLTPLTAFPEESLGNRLLVGLGRVEGLLLLFGISFPISEELGVPFLGERETRLSMEDHPLPQQPFFLGSGVDQDFKTLRFRPQFQDFLGHRDTIVALFATFVCNFLK